MDEMLYEQAKTEWWLILIRGLFLLFFGFFALFWPGMTLQVLILIFSLYIAVDGVVNIIRGILSIGKKNSLWFLTLVLGLLEVLVGIYVFRHPGITLYVFMILIGAAFVARGVLEIILIFDKSEGHPALHAIAGILALIAGVAVLVYPAAGGIAFVWILGLYGLIAGPILIAVSLTLHSVVKKYEDENATKKK